MKITMIGSGYVGLVSGTCFADIGHSVTCVDKDENKVAALSSGIIPIYEPGLDVLLASNRNANRLNFTTDLSQDLADSDAVFIAVGTPSTEIEGFADLTYVYAAAREIAKHLDGYTVIVIKSTVPVGTGDEVEAIIRESRPNADFTVVSNPEFLREGSAIEDFMKPDRVVIGTDDEKAKIFMNALYEPLSKVGATVFFTDRRTSELVKYASNAFLAIKLTFINEIADLCEVTGADVENVAKGMGLDERIGGRFLRAGPGYGGSCFPKDTRALTKTAVENGSPLRTLQTVVEVNEIRKKKMALKIAKAMDGMVEDKVIAILGLAFKPNTDDMRSAPALDIVAELQAMGARVRVYDPEAMDSARTLMKGVEFCESAEKAVQDADAVSILTEWPEFIDMNLGKLRAQVRTPVLVDLRNIFDPEEARANGFNYTSIGRNESRL